MPEIYDPYRQRREKAASIRERRMGAVDFSLPVDGGLGVSSAKKAVARLSEANPYLTRMKKLSELLDSLPGEEIPFLKR